MRYKSFIWCAWMLLFLFSCAESEQAVDPVNPGEVRMSMNISTRATNDPEVLNANKTRISRLRIYVFDGTSLDKMYYWSGLTATDGTYTTPVFTVKAATGKTLYAIVNELVDMDTRAILEAVDHPNDLVDVQYQMADYLSTKTNVVEYTKEYCLPMYGELAGVDAAEGATQTVNMRVDRAVARVDVYMRKEPGHREEVYAPDRLLVQGVSWTGFISPEKISNYAPFAFNTLQISTATKIPEESSQADKGLLVYSFYIPEMECKDDESKLLIGMSNYEVIRLGRDANNSGGAPLEKLERNHVYQLLCRFTVKSLSLDMNILDWQDVEITGDIVGTDFDTDRTEITLIKDIVDPVKLVKVDCRITGRLRIRALKSNKTDLMSTSDLQLYCNGITESDKLVDNSGVYDLTAAQTMNFYCSTGSVPANYEGGFIEISSDNVHVKYIPIRSLDRFTPLDTEGTANSYIADRGAGSYSFTATVMGNGADGIIDEGKFENAMGYILTKATGANIHPLSARLLWQDTDELVEQVALVDGRVQVKMGRSRGNALIAVYDKADPNAEDAKVLWSWHLWCTDIPKILEFVTSIYTGNDYKVMDRNLGATTTMAAYGTIEGMHYQWGRKDPFSGSLTNDGVRTILYDVRSGQVVYEYPTNEQVTVGQSIRNPMSLHAQRITGSWCTKTADEHKYLWGNPDGNRNYYPKKTVKSLYDPCPFGYKIAPHDVFKILSKGDAVIFPPSLNPSLSEMYFVYDYSQDGTIFYYDNAGVDMTKRIYLPETYNPYYNVVQKLGKRGQYWSSSSGDGTLRPEGLMFNFHVYRTLDFEFNIANSVVAVSLGSIRCVKE